MSVTHVASSSAAATASTLAIPTPAGVQAGDVLICAVEVNTGTVTPPTGWNSIFTTATTPIFWRLATNSEGANVGTVTNTSAAYLTALCAAFRGADTASPIRGSGTASVFSGAPGPTFTAPSVTGALATDGILRVVQALENSGASNDMDATWPNGVTETGEKTYGSTLISDGLANQAADGATGSSAAAITVRSTGASKNMSGVARTIVIAALAAPVFATQPSITSDGTPQVGETFTCQPGSASGAPSFTYQWRRGSSSAMSDAVNISGATSASYTGVSADKDQYLDCRVTATNSIGATTATAPAIQVTAAGPFDDVTVGLTASGLLATAGAVGATLYDAATASPVRGRQTTAIAELATSGLYRIRVERPASGNYILLVDDGATTIGHAVAVPYIVP